MSLLSKCEETTLYKLEPKFTNLYTAPNPDRLYAPALFLGQVPSQYIRESDSFLEFLFPRHWHMVSDKLLPNLYWLKNKTFFLLTVVNNSWMYLSFMFLFCPVQIPSGWLGTLDNIFETSIVLFQLNLFELYTLKLVILLIFEWKKNVFWWISSQQDPGSVFPLKSATWRFLDHTK